MHCEFDTIGLDFGLFTITIMSRLDEYPYITIYKYDVLYYFVWDQIPMLESIYIYYTVVLKAIVLILIHVEFSLYMFDIAYI